MNKSAYTSIFLFLISTLSYSQNNNEYKIETNIKINAIKFEKQSSGYQKNSEPILIGVSLIRNSDSISSLYKLYDKNEDVKNLELTYLEEININSIKISTKKFDELVILINQLNINEINRSSNNINMTDGHYYKLTFSGEGYEMKMNVHSPNVDAEQRKLENFLKVCYKIWKLIEL